MSRTPQNVPARTVSWHDDPAHTILDSARNGVVKVAGVQSQWGALSPVHYNVFVPPAAKFWPKVCNHDKAKFATKLCKLSKDCVNVNNEE